MSGHPGRRIQSVKCDPVLLGKAAAYSWGLYKEATRRLCVCVCVCVCECVSVCERNSSSALTSDGVAYISPLARHISNEPPCPTE